MDKILVVHKIYNSIVKIKYLIKFTIFMKKVKQSCSLKYQNQEKVLLKKAKSKVARFFSTKYSEGNFQKMTIT